MSDEGQELCLHGHPSAASSDLIYCPYCPEGKDEGSHISFFCRQCELDFHDRKYDKASPEICHPSHPRHPLSLLRSFDAARKCLLCGQNLKVIAYHCSICEFAIDLVCAKRPPLLAIDNPKTHDHTLTLMPREVSFTCDACGIETHGQSPYVCPQCNFMVHKECIGLPRVIHINRHHHRVSMTEFLGPGKRICGVCRKMVDGRYGAYTCSKCTGYAVHSKCATRSDVWDGRELEGEPEETDETEDLMPYKVVAHNVINHFSHEEHNLKLTEVALASDPSMICEACTFPVSSESDPFYSCMDCKFALHEKCANLPRKIRHVLHNHPLTLRVDTIPKESEYYNIAFECSACKRLCSGFKYECCGIELDVRCGSISEPFYHKNHHHPLFLTSLDSKTCEACHEEKGNVLRCTDCDFALDFECATLPTIVKHKSDQHPLSLSPGEEAPGPYWCDICEAETSSKTWFYLCDDYCCSTLHVKCVIPDFKYMKLGRRLFFWRATFEVALNKRPSQKRYCTICGWSCEDDFFLDYRGKTPIEKKKKN
ncbi:PREDICTED: uncharacterized protein LOC104823943 isoform X2 [Tarenaya hassleriana]|uniref:uncharacterized protein LOC104823943 isoform X2 n=1 Tax=Tarenaya hassleriana TaxID=28532 RepID=UPI00053C9458|nr:PREDICTED: uncharacterized protein LOC104823943 isoform X2 [Tarenaya hassleriana]